MPANPKDLYNALKDAGETSVSYEQFRKKWDTPGWNVDFHKQLRSKQMTSLSYEDFVYAFGDQDPDYNPNGKTIELSKEDLEGKQTVVPSPQLGPAKDTDSSGEKVSWASPEKIANIQKRFGGLDPKQMESPSITEDEINALNEYVARLDKKKPTNDLASAKKIANIQKAFGNNPQEMERATLAVKQVDDIETYVESLSGEDGGFNKSYGAGERFLDSFVINMPTNLEATWESTKGLVAHAYSKSQTGQPWAYTTKVQADQYLKEQLREVVTIQSKLIDTGSIVKGFKEGDAAEIAGGVFNAMQGLVSTVIPSMLTGGASLVPQVIAPVWTDYQITKANAMYGDQEDPIAALVDNNQVDNVVPLTLGVGMLALEHAGIKGVSKYLSGSKIGRTLMGIDTSKYAWLLTAKKEGLTEWTQAGMESVNTALAEGKSVEEAIKIGVDVMFSEEGLEAGIQGWAATGILTGPSALDRTVTRALRSDDEGSKVITGGIDAINELKERRFNEKSKVVHKVIDKEIKAVETEMKRVLRANNKLIKHLSPADTKTLKSIMKGKDQIVKDIAALDQTLADGEITQGKRNYYVGKLNQDNALLSGDIAMLKENVDKSKIYHDIKLAEKLAKSVPNLEVQAFDNAEELITSLEGAINEEGKPYTSKELQKIGKESAGLFWKDSNGVEHITINTNESLKGKLTATGQHEFLHKVLGKVLTGNPKLANKFAKEAQTSLQTLVESGQLQANDKYQQRMKAYEEESPEIYAEESLVLLSEALTSGDIQIQELPKTFLGKLKELVRRSFLDLGITSVNLEGDGVLQFLQDYNREFARGKLSKATKKLMEGDAADLLNPTKIKQSLDYSTEIEWSKKPDDVFGEMLSSNIFIIDGEKYSMIITPDDEGMGMEMTSDRKVGEITFNNMTSGTPTRSLLNKNTNALKVFGAVVNGTKKAVEQGNYDAITFTANDEGRRAILYAAIAKKVSSQLGWTVKTDNNYGAGMTRFILSKPKGSKIKQSKTDLYERTDALYDPKDVHTSGFMIALEWENQIKSLSRKYTNLPGYSTESVDDLVAATQSAGSQSILGLVKSFKPDTKTTDKSGTVSLAGYINKWLPKYVNSHLHEVGIGDVEAEYDEDGNQIEGSGFNANVSDMVNLTSEERADDLITQDESVKAEKSSKYQTTLEATKIAEKNPEIIDHLEKQVGLNLSHAIKLFGTPKTVNMRKDPFITTLRMGLKDDADAHGVMKKFMVKYGYEKFLGDFKEVFLANTERADLAKSPFYKRVVQQRFKGKWKTRERYTNNGKVSWEFLNDKGEPYGGRHPDMDRMSASDEKGNTAGHYFYRKNPNLKGAISDNEFIDFHFSDGPKRKRTKAAPLNSMAKQFSAEMSLDLFEKQLLAGEGRIFDIFKGRMQLTSIMTPDEIAKAIEKKYLVREGLGGELTDRAIAETLKDLERGGIRQSKVNKTGFNWFDRPRIDMTNYLASLENNDIRDRVVNNTIASTEYASLYNDMLEAYDMYLGMMEQKDEWADNLQSYASEFKDKNFSDFDAFLDDTLNQVKNSVDGILGLDPGATSFGTKNATRKRITKKEGVEAFANDRINEATDKSAELAKVVKTLIGATAGGPSSGLYLNTPGFYEDFVVPMVNAHGINPKDFRLVDVEGGTTITHKGDKITTNFSRGVFSDDTFEMFDDLANSPKTLDNNIDLKGRMEEAKLSGELYLDYVKWMQENKERLSPTTVGMMMKGFSSRGRSVAQVMHPLTGAMIVQENSGIKDYTTVPTVPPSYVSLAALKYIMTGKGLTALNSLVKDGTTAIMPKVFAKVVNQFHHSTPNNNYDTTQINNKLQELDLPKISLVDLNEPFIPVANLEAIKGGIKFSKTTKAIGESLKFSKKVPKGISVWDFDDTLAKTKSRVIYTDVEGKTQKLTPAEFAEQGDGLMAQGITFDFSEFSKVVKGKKGPLFDTAVKRNEKFGNEHVYILTARPQASATAIHEFLKGIGLEVRIENITGLQNSDPQAKADWVLTKVSEGYNDFYFADDHIGNVKAVSDILKDNDVKSVVVQAKIKQSKTLSGTFNEMLERTTGIKGIGTKKVINDVAHLRGRDYDRKAKARLRLFVPPSAEDYIGLLYRFMGTKKQGDQDKNWIMTNLVDPYLEGVNKLDIMNTLIGREYKQIKKEHPQVVNKLHDLVEGTTVKYTNDMAVRYYLYERSGYGDLLRDNVAAKDAMVLMKTVMLDKKMRSFADAVSVASKRPEGYIKPDSENWLLGSIATDFKSLVTDAHRKSVLQQFIDNTDEVFSRENLNKIESVYGTKFTKALTESIARMKSGTKRLAGTDKLTRSFTHWINGAIAPIMFWNQRSAMLQLISATNFINWTDNNPLKIAQTMTSPKQFAEDVMMIMKSPKMVQRRGGLRFSIEEAELANVGGTDSFRGLLMKKLIKVGFAPTQAADAIAISIGGAPFYRNRVNTYKKATNDDGSKKYTTEEAEKAAWIDFSKISDEAQQSSDQMLTSSEQAGGLGRIVLAFSNTPAQYTRLIKKAALDVRNGRGDLKTNLSKIAYYGAIQNLMFTFLQNAMFSTYGLFTGDDEDDMTDEELIEKREREEEKEARLANGVMDTLLRGMGARGAVIATLKTTVWNYVRKQPGHKSNVESLKTARLELEAALKEDDVAKALLVQKKLDGLKERAMLDFSSPLLDLLSVSPPLGSKARDFVKMTRNLQYNKSITEEKGWAWDSPRWMTYGLGAKVAFNLPGDWLPKKAMIYKAISEGDGNDAQNSMMMLGWSEYDMGIENTDFKTIKDSAGATRSEESGFRRKAVNELKKKQKNIVKADRTPTEIKQDSIAVKKKRKASAQKAAVTRKENKDAQNLALWEKAQSASKKRRNNTNNN